METLKTMLRWFRDNPIKSKVIITISHLVILIAGSVLGFCLFVSGIDGSVVLLNIIAVLFILLYYKYPKVDAKRPFYDQSFKRLKVFDFSIALCFVLAVVVGTMNFLGQPNQSSTSLPKAEAKLIVHKLNKKPTKDRSLRGWWKKFKEKRTNIRKVAKEMRRAYKSLKAEKKSTVGITLIKALTLTLCIVGYVGLFIGSCSLACNGYGPLALFLALGGSILITLALYAVFKRQNQKLAEIAASSGSQ